MRCCIVLNLNTPCPLMERKDMSINNSCGLTSYGEYSGTHNNTK
jgi:hypothetical protein